MKLEVDGIEVPCVIGERPDERHRTQLLRVDVALEIGAAAAESDELSDTVDYAALAARIRAALQKARCRMIERAARVALDVCRAEPQVAGARVRVEKRGTVPGLASAAVTLDWPTAR